MRVKLPSAGTKDTTRSAANRLSRTLGWKLYSSIRWLLLRLMEMSGIPLSRLFTSTVPGSRDSRHRSSDLDFSAPLNAITQWTGGYGWVRVNG
jgi:hypothetical protein